MLYDILHEILIKYFTFYIAKSSITVEDQEKCGQVRLSS